MAGVNARGLTLNVLYHTTSHKKCTFEVKDAHGFHCFA